jgi:hypothetical protein
MVHGGPDSNLLNTIKVNAMVCTKFSPSAQPVRLFVAMSLKSSVDSIATLNYSVMMLTLAGAFTQRATPFSLLPPPSLSMPKLPHLKDALSISRGLRFTDHFFSIAEMPLTFSSPTLRGGNFRY